MPRLKKLRLFRLEKEMTKEQFAKELGYHRVHYSKIENGEYKPTTRLIDALVEKFGLTYDEARELTKN